MTYEPNSEGAGLTQGGHLEGHGASSRDVGQWKLSKVNKAGQSGKDRLQSVMYCSNREESGVDQVNIHLYRGDWAF